MTTDGTTGYSYSWDAENRLTQITYSGIGNNTQFTYDPLGRCVKIVENGTVSNTMQFVWDGTGIFEQRDVNGNLTNGKQFFGLGQINFSSGTGTNYFYRKDQLGSVREMTDSSGNIVAQYGYDPYGKVTPIGTPSVNSDFQYAGMYLHARSGLNLTLFRQYNSQLGRWLSRDPIGEAGGLNLYGYAGGNPISLVDPLGLLTGDAAFDSMEAEALGKAAPVLGQPGAYLYSQVGYVHTGIFIDFGPKFSYLGHRYWTINGFYSQNYFAGNLIARVRNDVKRPGTDINGALDWFPQTQDPETMIQLINEGFKLEQQLKQCPMKYSAVPGVTGSGDTSNEVPPYLFRKVGLQYPWRFAPGAQIQLQPGTGGQ